ncbi:cell wall-binding repeat-containing protein [Bacillus infantis]|uniref:cell wall-binding repeat-containing protein n=1 Tax=Bacillus infantis TaxID=324767 RepID=UPI003CF84114
MAVLRVLLISVICISFLVYPADANAREAESLRSVTYTGEIWRDAETHYFKISTAREGIVQIEWSESSIGADAMITDENWSRIYGNGSKLPPGDYLFVVSTNPAEGPDDPERIQYEITLSGLSYKAPPATALPRLEIASPLKTVNILKAGNQAVRFEGESDAYDLRFGIWGKGDIPEGSLASPFNEELFFTDESPVQSIYRISAGNKEGNRINRNYEFLHPRVVPLSGTSGSILSVKAAHHFLEGPYNHLPEKADAVILANPKKAELLLASSPLPRALNAPVLFAEGNNLEESLKKQLAEIHPEKVYLIGSRDAIKQEIEQEIKMMGLGVERITGNSQYSFAAQAAEKLTEAAGSWQETAFIVNGTSQADAAAAAGMSASLGIPSSWFTGIISLLQQRNS